MTAIFDHHFKWTPSKEVLTEGASGGFSLRSKKSSNFGAKIQICLKIKFSQNWIFEWKIRPFRKVRETYIHTHKSIYQYRDEVLSSINKWVAHCCIDVLFREYKIGVVFCSTGELGMNIFQSMQNATFSGHSVWKMSHLNFRAKITLHFKVFLCHFYAFCIIFGPFLTVSSFSKMRLFQWFSNIVRVE